jgi:hypothetical protein
VNCVTEIQGRLFDYVINPGPDEAEPMHSKRSRKPDLLLVLTLLTGLGVLMTATVDAEERLFSNIDLFNNVGIDDLMDGNVQVAGNHRAGLHLSVDSMSQAAQYHSPHGLQFTDDADVYFSWKLSW